MKITDQYNANNHVMGGTIMGRDPKDSVVDADCRTHDHESLYIAGGATMPSASSINSTLSMVAVSADGGQAQGDDEVMSAPPELNCAIRQFNRRSS